MTLEARGLAAIRGERLIFRNLSFHVSLGGVLLVVGRNGAGKSTLLRILAGLMHPVAGGVAWNGRPIDRERDTHRARVRYAGHLDAVTGALDVQRNLALWAALDGADRGVCSAALDRVGLARSASLPARFLSAGQRRRLAMARLLLRPAGLWLLDEPTVALDTAGNALLGELIAEHCGRGGIVVAASHTDLPVTGVDVFDIDAARQS